MITREQIEEVQAESRKRGISIKQTLQEKGISAHQYFRWKRRYAQEAVPAGFLPFPVIAGSTGNLFLDDNKRCPIRSGMTKKTRCPITSGMTKKNFYVSYLMFCCFL